MDFTLYKNIIVKRLWLLILLPVLASVSSTFINLMMLKPVYESSVTVYVINRDNSTSLMSYEDIMVSEQLVKDYREIIKSRSVTKTVLQELEIDELTPDMLADMVFVDHKNETRILELRIRDSNPERAKNLADVISRVFMEKVRNIMKIENVEIIDKAETPIIPVSPKPVANIAISFAGGVILSICIVALIEYMDDTVKTTQDVEKELGVTVLATIPLQNIE